MKLCSALLIDYLSLSVFRSCPKNDHSGNCCE